jgi:hypothetical protein
MTGEHMQSKQHHHELPFNSIPNNCPLGAHSEHTQRIERSEWDIQTLFAYHKDLSKTVTSILVKVSTIVGIGTGLSIAGTFIIQICFK